MPPILALVLCTILVLFLLWNDRKQSQDVSYISWIPTIWMLIHNSKSLGLWFGTKGSNDAGSPLDRIFETVLLCLGIFILTKQKFNWLKIVKNNIWISLILSYMLISIFWSDIPFISLKRWTKELVAVIMACLLLTEQNPYQTLISLIRRTIFVLIPYSVLLIKYFDEIGIIYDRWSGEAMWVGVTMQKNGLGMLCSISAFFLIWTLSINLTKNKLPINKSLIFIDIFILFLTLWLLKGPPNAYSATSIIVFVFGLVVFFGLQLIKKLNIVFGSSILILIIMLMIGFGISVPLLGGLSFGKNITSNIGRDITLTGRTEVWAKLIPAAMQQPILGHGIGGFWTTAAQEKYFISGPHNGYLAIFTDFGLIGILLFTMFLISTGIKIQKSLNFEYYFSSLWFCFLLMGLIQNTTEAGAESFTAPTMIILVLFMIVFSSRDSIFTNIIDKKNYINSYKNIRINHNQ